MSQVDNDNDQGGSDHEDDQNKPPEDENEVLEGDQKSPHSNQEDNEPSQNDQIKSDKMANGQMETSSEQDDQSKIQKILIKARSKPIKIKTDQNEQSTPPHMTNTNADSQATKIIDSDSNHDSQEYHTPDHLKMAVVIKEALVKMKISNMIDHGISNGAPVTHQ